MGNARELAAERIKELGRWLEDHADALTAEMDEMVIAERGLTINSDITTDGIQSVHVVKNYILVNR